MIISKCYFFILRRILQKWASDFLYVKLTALFYARWKGSNDGRIRFIRDSEYSIFSQHGEDGVLRFLMNKLSKNKRFFEIGFHATESNCLNLAVNHGFTGCFVDAEKDHCNKACSLYKKLNLDVDVINTYANRNINEIYGEKYGTKEVDVFSIDVDGVDYWIWKYLEVDPRVVVVEYNSLIDIVKGSATVPYSDVFDNNGISYYHGASLSAFSNLGRNKGYSLVYCESAGVNAFFVRNDLLSLFESYQFFPHWVPNRGRWGGEKDIRDCEFVDV